MFKLTKSVKTSSNLSTEIDSIVSVFTTTIDSLKQKANEANAIKAAKEEEILTLQQECDRLSEVSARASKLSNNISKIFDENGGSSDC